MHFSSNLIVASLCVIASTFATAAPAKSNHPQTAINSQDDFCLFLPPKPGLIVAENEDNGIPFCIKPDTVPNATTFPEGFITTAHYLKSSKYVQVTGFFDREKYELGAADGGGQFDNHAHGKPVGAECQNYKYFVSLIEPDIDRFCIRCCQEEADCNTGRSGYGCLRVIDGNYDRDDNMISNSTSKSSHLNTNMNSVLSDLNYLPESSTPANSDANANDAIVAEIEKFRSTNQVEALQTQWNASTDKLVSDYPEVAEQIQQLNSITKSLDTIEQWNTFFDLVSEKIIQLQQTSSTTTASTATSTTHTATNEDLDWLFEHRNSHDNQATW